jgi:hypothetical protein
MKAAPLVISAAIIVLANALALVHAARNRTGAPEAEITLTQRELVYFNSSAHDDNSGVTLHLEWTDPSNTPFPSEAERSTNWLDRQKLRSLGFACDVSPTDRDAGRYYQRQRSRRAFVALEYDGAAWRNWMQAYERGVAEQGIKLQFQDLADNASEFSHLVPIDADLDPLKLRARYTDRAKVIIVPAVIAITVEPFPYPGMKPDPQHPARVAGHIQQLPSSIHVPRPFSDEFHRLKHGSGEARDKNVFYRVRLRYGASFEPWITGVEFKTGK